MFGLLRLLVTLACLAVFAWFAVTVPIGNKTLWGHLRAIAGTEEAKDLAKGTKEEAEKVAQKVKAELHPQDMASDGTEKTSSQRRVKPPLPDPTR